MSPDALLAYCQIQLGNLDDQVTDQMDTQQLDLAERTAVQNVETTLESFGDQGPTTGDQLHTCVEAFQNAINQLPPGDPVAAQLLAQGQQMAQQYGYQVEIATPIHTPAASAVSASTASTATPSASTPGVPTPSVTAPAPATNSNAIYEIGHKPATGEWKGTTDAVSNLADDINSNAEMQMLTLQDLVSQRQQVVELATGMMSKEDETLTDGAKAIGQE
jgi:hypothetical protein